MPKRMKITLDGMVFHAAMLENPLAEQVAGMCPFKLDCTRSGEHEYYAALPQRANTAGCLTTTVGHRNGLYYFEGWNAMSLVFKDCDTTPYQIHQFGEFEEDVSAVLEKAGRSIHIQCEVEQEGF